MKTRELTLQYLIDSGVIGQDEPSTIEDLIEDGNYHDVKGHSAVMYAIQDDEVTILDSLKNLIKRFMVINDKFVQLQTRDICKDTNSLLACGNECLEQGSPMKWLVKGWIPGEKSLVQLFGPSGHGKSFVALDMALSIATGKHEWFGCPVKMAPVLYLCGEGLHGVKRRVKLWCQENDVNDLEGLFHFSRHAIAFNESAQMMSLTKELTDSGFSPKLIIVDTTNRFMGAGDENSTKDATAFIQACDQLALDFDACVMLVHHVGWNPETQNRGRGSSAFYASMDMEYHVEKNDGVITLEQTKNKDSEPLSPMYFRLEEREIHDWYEDDGSNEKSAVIVATSKPSTDKSDKQISDEQLCLDAFVAKGIETADGNIFITRDAFIKFTTGKLTNKEGHTLTDRQMCDQFNPKQERKYISRLLRYGIVSTKNGPKVIEGWYLIDEEMSEIWRQKTTDDQTEIPF